MHTSGLVQATVAASGCLTPAALYDVAVRIRKPVRQQQYIASQQHGGFNVRALSIPACIYRHARLALGEN